jgi:hypothetical protein
LLTVKREARALVRILLLHDGERLHRHHFIGFPEQDRP